MTRFKGIFPTKSIQRFSRYILYESCTCTSITVMYVYINKYIVIWLYRHDKAVVRPCNWWGLIRLGSGRYDTIYNLWIHTVIVSLDNGKYGEGALKISQFNTTYIHFFCDNWRKTVQKCYVCFFLIFWIAAKISVWY